MAPLVSPQTQTNWKAKHATPITVEVPLNKALTKIKVSLGVEFRKKQTNQYTITKQPESTTAWSQMVHIFITLCSVVYRSVCISQTTCLCSHMLMCLLLSVCLCWTLLLKYHHSCFCLTTMQNVCNFFFMPLMHTTPSTIFLKDTSY